MTYLGLAAGCVEVAALGFGAETREVLGEVADGAVGGQDRGGKGARSCHVQVAALTRALAGGGGQLAEGDELGDPRGGHLWLWSLTVHRDLVGGRDVWKIAVTSYRYVGVRRLSRSSKQLRSEIAGVSEAAALELGDGM